MRALLAWQLWHAIRNGATRNLYVANVPETISDAELTALFTPFGEMESIRIGPKKGAAFINYTSIAAAIKAKENVHKQTTIVGADPAPKPLLINFTSAQQNCMRARGGGRPAAPPPGHRGGFRAAAHEKGGHERRNRPRSGGKTGEKSADGEVRA